MDVTSPAPTGEICEALKKSYEDAQALSRQWQFWQLNLGIATVVVIIAGMALVILGLRDQGLIASALALVTGGAAVWFNGRVTFWYEKSREALREWAEKCPDEMVTALRAGS